ncbi:FAD dependent oxidoreductase-like protein superfamily [Trematosphaeria pertusa]|uniref:FAD dependent oxidoreductase-like protein superfamily n=1 Tax=Trematosphaeria pertusa TaxID=390896 RepID=A0A6A6HV45_9PLEO|nr:FAD dependent oxidoreductase-like protein superfamily [Trematosphaeria pertusa]KAF2241632.1 FAD dependent oxidoreductase-like protein superfamily [Trematosphaeria pertusa]
MSNAPGNTVILGAGIVGLSTAYFLSQTGNTAPSSIHLVDSSPQLFQCASGLAGGFLARDWFAPSNASLGALSYRLHKELAEKHNGRTTWGYCQSTGISLSQDSEAAVGGSGEDWLQDGTSRAQATNSKRTVGSNGPVWLKQTEDGNLEVISQTGTTAQIDPLRFCQWLLGRCLERGVQLHQPANAISVLKDENDQLNGIRLSKNGEEADCMPRTNRIVPCTRLLITAGAWSPRVFSKLFPKSTTQLPISALAGHSLLVRNPFWDVEEENKEICHAVFATDTLGFSPEWFSRIGGELYLAGLNSTMIPLPDVATDVEINPSAMEQLKDCAKAMVGTVDGKNMEVMREALCFRPVTGSGRPIVCRVPDEQLGGGLKTRGGGDGGVFIAAGHGAWGISQSPGTGLVMSELIEGRPTSANLSALVLPS